MSARWEPGEECQLMALVKAGHSYATIARIMHRTIGSVRTRAQAVISEKRPVSVNNLTLFLRQEVARQNMSVHYVEQTAGVARGSLSQWQRRHGATLASVEAVAAVLGYELVLEKVE